MRRLVARLGTSLPLAIGASLVSLVGIVVAGFLGETAVAMLEAVLCGWSMAQCARLVSLQPVRREVVGRAASTEAKTTVAG